MVDSEPASTPNEDAYFLRCARAATSGEPLTGDAIGLSLASMPLTAPLEPRRSLTELLDPPWPLLPKLGPVPTPATDGVASATSALPLTTVASAAKPPTVRRYFTTY